MAKNIECLNALKHTIQLEQYHVFSLSLSLRVTKSPMTEKDQSLTNFIRAAQDRKKNHLML